MAMKRLLALIIPILFLLASCLPPWGGPVFAQEHAVDRYIREMNEALRGSVPDTVYVVTFNNYEVPDDGGHYQLKVSVRVFTTILAAQKFLDGEGNWIKEQHCWRVVGDESVELHISVTTTRAYKIGPKK